MYGFDYQPGNECWVSGKPTDFNYRSRTGSHCIASLFHWEFSSALNGLFLTNNFLALCPLSKSNVTACHHIALGRWMYSTWCHTFNISCLVTDQPENSDTHQLVWKSTLRCFFHHWPVSLCVMFPLYQWCVCQSSDNCRSFRWNSRVFWT